MTDPDANNIDWEALLDLHGRALVLYARQWCSSLADAQDALQEGFIKVWRFWKNDSRDPLPYLYKAVKHSAIDQVRRWKRTERTREKLEHEARGKEGVTLFETGMESDERRTAIEAALKELPEEQREVIVMKIWGDMTFAQIAESLGISPNTAASRYRYAVTALRDRVDQEAVA